MQKYFRWLSLFIVIVASGASALADEYALDQNVMVPMRDGVRLATDIYRPVKDGKVQEEPLTVILSRLPYNKDGQSTAAQYYAKHGYVFVAQDTPGRYNSEGIWHMLTDDGPDGVDCAAWIGKQSGLTARSSCIRPPTCSRKDIESASTFPVRISLALM